MIERFGYGFGSAAYVQFAVDFFDVGMTEILLRYKADANQKTYLGDRLLHVAIRKKNSGMVNLLLRAGADPNRTNENDETPLQAASAIGDSKILEMLQSAGAK